MGVHCSMILWVSKQNNTQFSVSEKKNRIKRRRRSQIFVMLSRDIGEENSKCAVRAVFTLLPMNNYRLGLKLGLALLFTDECY